MAPPAVRPTFELEIDRDPDAVMEHLRQRLRNCPRCTGMSIGRHAELFVPEEDRRIWSPWLSVTAHAGECGTIVRGRFAPHPSVWTFYLFLAFGLAFSLLVCLAWGYAQWAMDAPPWAFGSAPLILVLAAALYGISILGQRLSASQMIELQSTLEELIR